MEPHAAVSLVGQMPIALDGLKHIFNAAGFRVVQVAAELAQLRSVPEAGGAGELPHLVVIDDLAERWSPASVTEALRIVPSARVVVLADQFDFATMKACFDARAYGYIVKTIASISLVTSLHLVAVGEKALPSNLLAELPAATLTPAGAAAINRSLESAGLSLREMEILSCLVSGQPNKVISRQLNISEATVKVHVKAILRKVGVQNRTQAAIWAMEGKATEAGSAGNGDGRGLRECLDETSYHQMN